MVTEFTRDDPRPVIEDPQAKQLFSQGLAPFPEKGRAIVVLAADWCPHCHESMKANNYPTQTKNGGIPIIWMNAPYKEVRARFADIEGVISTGLKDDAAKKVPRDITIGNTKIQGYPVAIEIVDGKAVSVLAAAANAVRVVTAGDKPVWYTDIAITGAGAFEEMAKRLIEKDLQRAKEQVKAALEDKTPLATTVPTLAKQRTFELAS